MTHDPNEPGDVAGEAPTVVVAKAADQPAGRGASLWSRVEAAQTSGDEDAVREVAQAVQGLADAQPLVVDGSSDAARATLGEKADLAKERAGALAGDAKEKAGAFAGDAKEKAGAAAGDAKEKAGAFAGASRERAAAFAASARERAANTDVKELAASTTSLIDTARPFFLAAFAVVFTVLAFVGGDHATSQIFAVGAIIFVIAAAFSDELGHLLPRARREGQE